MTRAPVLSLLGTLTLFSASGCAATADQGLEMSRADCEDPRGDVACANGALACLENTYPSSQWPALGYLVYGLSPRWLAGPQCGAALIAPNLAVTAAHCVIDPGTSEVRAGVFGFGVGTAGSKWHLRATRVAMHPGYLRNDRVSIPNDLAVLELDGPFIGIEPLGVAAVAPGPSACDTLAFAVSYGRPTPGGEGASFLAGFRRYTSLCSRTGVVEAIPAIFATSADDRFLCWGDSGSALVSDAGHVMGVLAHFDPDDFGSEHLCRSGNTVVFASLALHRDWLDRERSRAREALARYRVFGGPGPARGDRARPASIPISIPPGTLAATVRIDVAAIGDFAGVRTSLERVANGRVVERISPFDFAYFPQTAQLPSLAARDIGGEWRVVVAVEEGSIELTRANLVAFR